MSYSISRKYNRRFDFESLNREREYLDNLAIDIISSLKSQISQPHDFQFRSTSTSSTSSISSPHRVSTLDISHFTTYSTKSQNTAKTFHKSPPEKIKFDLKSEDSFASFLSDSDHATLSKLNPQTKPKTPKRESLRKRNDQNIDDFVDNITDYTRHSL